MRAQRDSTTDGDDDSSFSRTAVSTSSYGNGGKRGQLQPFGGRRGQEWQVGGGR